MANIIQIKRGLFASLPTLNEGEFGFSTDTKQVHIGDGVANYELLTQNSYNATSFLYATSDNTPENKTPAEVMAILSGNAGASFAMNSQKITGLANGVDANDAVNKSQLDAVSGGLDAKDSVRCATTANITIATDLNVGDVIDGVTLADGDRVLVKDQTAGEENGIYVAGAVPARSDDANSDADVTGGMYCFVTEGTANADTGFVLTTNDPITLGTTSLSFTEFSRVDLSTWAGSTSVTTLGTIGTGEWQGTAIADAYISSAATWNAKQDALTFGIANTNALKVDDADAADNDYAKLTATGIEGRSYSEVLGDLSGQAAAAFAMNSQKITGLADPTLAQDAATKNYVDTVTIDGGPF